MIPLTLRPRTVAALFVEEEGPYAALPGVELWTKARDARRYDGPFPVVAHPPCERWGRYWFGGPSVSARKSLGDDGGCFAAALAAVRRWGGVIEHPEASHAWRKFGIVTPPKERGWIPFHSAEERRRKRPYSRSGPCERLSKRQLLLTPPAFAELMLSLARLVP